MICGAKSTETMMNLVLIDDVLAFMPRPLRSRIGDDRLMYLIQKKYHLYQKARNRTQHDMHRHLKDTLCSMLPARLVAGRIMMMLG